jgi:hypothetical protein
MLLAEAAFGSSVQPAAWRPTMQAKIQREIRVPEATELLRAND